MDGWMDEFTSDCRAYMFPSLKKTQALPHKNRLGQSGAVWSRRSQEAGPGDPLRLPRLLSNLVLAPLWALT